MDWNIESTGIAGKIAFQNQTELAEFVVKLAQISDKMGHHADMIIRYNVLELNIVTHDANAVTEKDHALCREIERFLSE